MRATISFETDLEQVEGKMAVLACSEEHNLRAAADILSNHNVLEFNTLDAITEVLRLLEDSTTQLQQYRTMLVNFERSKYDTVLPQSSLQSVANVGEAVSNLNKFGDFIDRLNAQGADEEGTDDVEPATEW